MHASHKNSQRQRFQTQGVYKNGNWRVSIRDVISEQDDRYAVRLSKVEHALYKRRCANISILINSW